MKYIVRKNKRFYHQSGEPVTDQETLERLKKLYVPPAWTEVKYAASKHSHVQVHGIDAGGKKQYILSQQWINKARSKKYSRLRSFIKDLPSFRKKIKLPPQSKEQINKETLIKLLFNLLLDTHIRVGNEKYAKSHSTYGLTTLRQKHIINENNVFYFSFVGKSKIKHLIKIPEEYNSFIKQLYKGSSRNPLFITTNGEIIDSEELNNYLKQHMGGYTCKDFRTYSANIVFIKTFLKKLKENKPIVKLILQSIDESAQSLGNSRTICKKSYISDNLINYCTNLKNTNVSYSLLLSEV
jgi:DNA topoisomerase-1